MGFMGSSPTLTCKPHCSTGVYTGTIDDLRQLISKGCAARNYEQRKILLDSYATLCRYRDIINSLSAENDRLRAAVKALEDPVDDRVRKLVLDALKQPGVKVAMRRIAREEIQGMADWVSDTLDTAFEDDLDGDD